MRYAKYKGDRRELGRFRVAVSHGEGDTVFHIVDSAQPQDEQPAIVESWSLRKEPRAEYLAYDYVRRANDVGRHPGYDANPARMKARITSFMTAKRFYQESRNGKLGHNTTVVEASFGGMEAYAIRYHHTNIVTYTDTGLIYLDSGGYKTATTKSHMNSVLPPGVSVYQKNYDWYVVQRPGSAIDFADGMAIKNPNHEWEQQYGSNPMRRPQKGDDLHAMGFGNVSLSEAQSIYDRAHRKTAEPDPRAKMLAEARRKPIGGTTMKDYRKAIREPLPGAHISGVTARTQQLAAAYPLDIWREEGPRWEGPFAVGDYRGGVFHVGARADTITEAFAFAMSLPQGANVEVRDRHDITVAKRENYDYKGRDRTLRPHMEYIGNPEGDHLTGYLENSYVGTRLTDFNGKATKWEVADMVKEWRTVPDHERRQAVILRKGNTTTYAGGLWLADGGTLFRGAIFGRVPGHSGSPSLRDSAVEEAGYWLTRDANEAAGEEYDDEE